MKSFSHSLARRSPFFYGYVMLLLAVIMQLGTSPGQTFAVSAFTPALLQGLGLSQSRLGLAYMLGTVLAAIPLSLVGPAADRHGLKRITVIVVVGLSGACFFASSINGFYGLLAAFFLLRFLGQGSLTLLSGNTSAMWFRSRIGRASAVMAVGSAIAFAWIPQWLKQSIAAFGWRETYQGIGYLLVLGLLPLVVFFFVNRPEDVGQDVDGDSPTGSRRDDDSQQSGDPQLQTPASGDERTPHETHDDRESLSLQQALSLQEALSLRQALRTGSFYILGLTNIVWAMSGTGVLFFLYTLCEERAIPPEAGNGLFKILGLSMLALQLCGGILSDFMRLGRLFGLGATLIAAGLTWLSVDGSLTGAQAFTALFGAGQGMLISVSGVAWLRFYGREHLGSIRGSVWCGTVAGSGCGPLLMGWSKDYSGSYDAAIYLFTAMMIPLALAAWLIQPPAKETEISPRTP